VFEVKQRFDLAQIFRAETCSDHLQAGTSLSLFAFLCFSKISDAGRVRLRAAPDRHRRLPVMFRKLPTLY
jgi:hypothetical protein